MLQLDNLLVRDIADTGFLKTRKGFGIVNSENRLGHDLYLLQSQYWYPNYCSQKACLPIKTSQFLS